MPDEAHAARLERRPARPRRQQVLDDGVEVLLGRVPGLEQVVVERDLVDGLDRGLGVGVGGEQHALGAGHDLARLHEELGARQAGHALVGHQQRHLVAAHDEVAQDLEPLLPRASAQDPIALAELAAQVAGHGREHRGLVVDREDRGTPPTLTVVRSSHRRRTLLVDDRRLDARQAAHDGTARKHSAHAMPAALIPKSVRCVPSDAASGPTTAVPMGMRIVLAR